MTGQPPPPPSDDIKLEARFWEQEHRTIQVWSNLWSSRSLPVDDPRRAAARTAVLNWVFLGSSPVVLAGGLLALTLSYMTYSEMGEQTDAMITANIQVANQIKSQMLEQRRAPLTTLRDRRIGPNRVGADQKHDHATVKQYWQDWIDDAQAAARSKKRLFEELAERGLLRAETVRAGRMLFADIATHLNEMVTANSTMVLDYTDSQISLGVPLLVEVESARSRFQADWFDLCSLAESELKYWNQALQPTVRD